MDMVYEGCRDDILENGNTILQRQLENGLIQSKKDLGLINLLSAIVMEIMFHFPGM